MLFDFACYIVVTAAITRFLIAVSTWVFDDGVLEQVEEPYRITQEGPF